MDLHYGICYYYGKNKLSNIIKHLQVFNKIKQKNKKFWIVFTIDEKDPKKRENICKKFIIDNNLDVNFLHDYNWGGTIAALHLLFQHLKKHKDSYIAFFEEDFTATNNDWLQDAIKYLPGYYYVGEGTIQSIDNPDLCQIKVCDSRYMIRYKFIKLYQNEAWTDGGFYFSTISNLKKINEKIGIFHKGDQNTKYTNGNDGIDMGEIGFPSSLFNNNFKFTGLFRNKYFFHDG